MRVPVFMAYNSHYPVRLFLWIELNDVKLKKKKSHEQIADKRELEPDEG
jgi:hypothetical protein